MQQPQEVYLDDQQDEPVKLNKQPSRAAKFFKAVGNFIAKNWKGILLLTAVAAVGITFLTLCLTVPGFLPAVAALTVGAATPFGFLAAMSPVAASFAFAGIMSGAAFVLGVLGQIMNAITNGVDRKANPPSVRQIEKQAQQQGYELVPQDIYKKFTSSYQVVNNYDNQGYGADIQEEDEEALQQQAQHHPKPASSKPAAKQQDAVAPVVTINAA